MKTLDFSDLIYIFGDKIIVYIEEKLINCNTINCISYSY